MDSKWSEIAKSVFLDSSSMNVQADYQHLCAEVADRLEKGHTLELQRGKNLIKFDSIQESSVGYSLHCIDGECEGFRQLFDLPVSVLQDLLANEVKDDAVVASPETRRACPIGIEVASSKKCDEGELEFRRAVQRFVSFSVFAFVLVPLGFRKTIWEPYSNELIEDFTTSIWRLRNAPVLSKTAEALHYLRCLLACADCWRIYALDKVLKPWFEMRNRSGDGDQ